jgi:hypothetical protein
MQNVDAIMFQNEYLEEQEGDGSGVLGTILRKFPTTSKG